MPDLYLNNSHWSILCGICTISTSYAFGKRQRRMCGKILFSWWMQTRTRLIVGSRFACEITIQMSYYPEQVLWGMITSVLPLFVMHYSFIIWGCFMGFSHCDWNSSVRMHRYSRHVCEEILNSFTVKTESERCNKSSFWWCCIKVAFPVCVAD